MWISMYWSSCKTYVNTVSLVKIANMNFLYRFWIHYDFTLCKISWFWYKIFHYTYNIEHRYVSLLLCENIQFLSFETLMIQQTHWVTTLHNWCNIIYNHCYGYKPCKLWDLKCLNNLRGIYLLIKAIRIIDAEAPKVVIWWHYTYRKYSNIT